MILPESDLLVDGNHLADLVQTLVGQAVEALLRP